MAGAGDLILATTKNETLLITMPDGEFHIKPAWSEHGICIRPSQESDRFHAYVIILRRL